MSCERTFEIKRKPSLQWWPFFSQCNATLKQATLEQESLHIRCLVRTRAAVVFQRSGEDIEHSCLRNMQPHYGETLNVVVGPRWLEPGRLADLGWALNGFEVAIQFAFVSTAKPQAMLILSLSAYRHGETSTTEVLMGVEFLSSPME